MMRAKRVSQAVLAVSTARWALAALLGFSVPSARSQADGDYFDPVGKRYVFSAETLPAPDPRPAMNFPQVVARPAGARLHLPKGFSIDVFAGGGFRNPRNLQVAPNGDFFVVDSGARSLIVLRDADGDGRAETREVFAEGLNRPFGVAFREGYVYVGNTDAIVRFGYRPGQTRAQGPPQTVVANLPAGGQNNHWTRNLLFSPDSTRLMISVGSASNIGEEPEFRAAILTCDAEGRGLRVFAGGLRNPVGLAWHPRTGALWTAVNERDLLGDDLVPDYVTSVKEGGFYGWPYFYIGANYDERMRGRGRELGDKVLIPDVLVESHSAALGLAFYTGTMFPEEYRGDLFVAFHGSWNRTRRTGYKIVRVGMNEDGSPVGGYENFVTGWLPEPASPTVWGRPVMVTVAPDGALLVVDDGGNLIWRVSYARP